MNTYYTAFKLSYNASQETLSGRKLDFAINALLESGTHLYAEFKAVESKEDAKDKLFWIKYRARDDRDYWGSYKDTYFIADCDRRGNYIPTVGTIKKALDFCKLIIDDKSTYDSRISKETAERILKMYENMKPAEIRAKLLNS